MYIYKGKIQSDESIDRLKFIIVVRGDYQNKVIIGDTWSPTASMWTLRYLLKYDSKHKSRVHPFYFIGAFIQANIKYRDFVKLDSRYGEYFP